MFYKSKIGKNFKWEIYCIFLVTLILIFSISVQGQTEEIISKFLLNESELIGYKLISQFRNDWIVYENDQLHKSIRQTWITHNIDKEKEVIVDICVFNSLSEAICGTAYSSGTYESLFLWGSNNGAIRGDCSWIEANVSGVPTMILVRGNVGAHIGFPIAKGYHRAEEIEAITYKILTKIEENLSQEILSEEKSLRQKRGSLEEYQTIIDTVVYSETMNGFSLHTTWDSKWLIESDSIVMGIRKEWKNERGSLVGIDICKFDSYLSASKAASTRSRMAYCSVFNLNNIDLLKSILSEWQNTWQYGLPKNLFSVVAVVGNISVHVYQFDPTGIDTNFFFSIVANLSRYIKLGR